MRKLIGYLFLAIISFCSTSFSQQKILINDIAEKVDSPNVNLIESNDQRIVFQIQIPIYEKYKIDLQDETFDVIEIKGFNGRNEVGSPDLPVIGKAILLPNDSPFSVTIDGNKYVEIENVFIAPVEPPAPENTQSLDQFMNQKIYQRNAYFPDQMAQTEPIKVMRGYHLTFLRFSPVKFNPQTRKARIYYDFTVTVKFSDSNFKPIPENRKSNVFSNLMKSFVSNKRFVDEVDAKKQVFAESEFEFFTGCDYLIVTHRKFLEAANSLAEWKRFCGLETKIVTVDEIGESADEIRNYLQYCYEHWDPAPTYVLFLGDAEYIPTNYYTQHSTEDNGTIGTDLYYTTTDGDDYFPDMISGRIPVDEEIEANAFVEKVISYEKNPLEQPSFYQRAVVASYFQDDDDPDTNYNERDGYEDRRFVLTSEEIRNFLLGKGYSVQRVYYAKPAVNPTHYNNGNYANGESLPKDLLRQSGFAWDGDADDISAAIEKGIFLLSHRDHGSRRGWGDPSYITGNVKKLTNGSRLPVVMSMNCETGWFDNETDDAISNTSFNAECFVEAWIRNLKGGAVGVFGSTRISYSGYNDALSKGIIDAIWSDFLPENPIEVETFGLGEALNYGKLVMAQSYGDSKTRKVEFEEFHFYGDPAMRIWKQMPQELQVFYSDTLFLNQTSFSVTTSTPYVTVTLLQDGKILATGETDQSGALDLNFYPIDSSAPVKLVARKPDFKPFLAEIIVTEANVKFPVISKIELIDENGNEEINIGENIRWNIFLKNAGNGLIENIFLTIACTDTEIVFDQSSCLIPAIDSRTEISVDSLSFHVSPLCSDGKKISAELQMIVGADTLLFPMDFIVQADKPEISVSPANIAENMDSGDSLLINILVKNEGFGPGTFNISDVSREYYALVDTSQQQWIASKTGSGNIFHVKENINLIQYKFFMKIDSPIQAAFYIYEGSELTGEYVLKWQKIEQIEKTGVYFLGTGTIDFSMLSDKYYFLGMAWSDGEAKICRSSEYPPVNFSFADLITGAVNLGGISPADTIQQTFSNIFAFNQIVDLGTSNWLELGERERRLLPEESYQFPIILRAPFADTTLQTFLKLKCQQSPLDSVEIPVTITTVKNVAEIVLNVNPVKDLGNEDGIVNCGENVILPVWLKNIGDQAVTSVELSISGNDSMVEVSDSLEFIEQINGGEEKIVEAFSFRVSPMAPDGYVESVIISAKYGDVEKQFPYRFSIRAGKPQLTFQPDTLFAIADTFLQSISSQLTVSNNGYGPFSFKVLNPVQHEYVLGEASDMSALPLENGCGNIYFIIKNTILQHIEANLEVISGGRVYFYLFEADSPEGEFQRLYYSYVDVSETGIVSVKSERINSPLLKNRYYYVGYSWNGEMKAVRLKQVAPISFTNFQVTAGTFSGPGFPPAETVNINSSSPLLISQKITLGKGTWFSIEGDTARLIPGSTVDLPITFFANESDTILTANLLLKSMNPNLSDLIVPVKFVVNAVATSVAEKISGVIDEFELEQNFPNPFNPTTTIAFKIARTTDVSIKIFNTLGQEITTLVSGKMNSGVYRLQWNGKDSIGTIVASGVYIVKMRAGEISLSRKIILLR